MKRDPLFLQFADILHEVPESEDALREWRRQQALRLIRKRNEERRKRTVDEGLDELCRQIRVTRAGKPDPV
jgi:hypothetical protein